MAGTSFADLPLSLTLVRSYSDFKIHRSVKATESTAESEVSRKFHFREMSQCNVNEILNLLAIKKPAGVKTNFLGAIALEKPIKTEMNAREINP